MIHVYATSIERAGILNQHLSLKYQRYFPITVFQKEDTFGMACIHSRKIILLCVEKYKKYIGHIISSIKIQKKKTMTGNI